MKPNLLLSLLLLLGLGLSAQPIRQGVAPRHYPQSPAPRVQVALILDVSGSMSGLLEQAKSQLWYIVNGVWAGYDGPAEPILELALFEYGNSSLGGQRRFMRQITPLTTEYDWVSDELQRLRSSGNAEYAAEAVDLALDQLQWSYGPQDLRLIYIAGNETFDQGRIPYPSVMHRALRQGVIVSTIYCGDYQRGVYDEWAEAARLGGGEYLSIDHNSLRNRPAGRWDPQVSSLNQRYNATYIPYGSDGPNLQRRFEAQDQHALRYGSATLTQRSLAKTHSSYRQPSWDLVDAVDAGAVRLEGLPDEQLPAEMRGMSLAQKQAYVARKKSEREQLRSEIRRLAEPEIRGEVAQAKAQGPASQAASGAAAEKQTLGEAIVRSAGTVKQVNKGQGQVQVQQSPLRSQPQPLPAPAPGGKGGSQMAPQPAPQPAAPQPRSPSAPPSKGGQAISPAKPIRP